MSNDDLLNVYGGRVSRSEVGGGAGVVRLLGPFHVEWDTPGIAVGVGVATPFQLVEGTVVLGVGVFTSEKWTNEAQTASATMALWSDADDQKELYDSITLNQTYPGDSFSWPNDPQSGFHASAVRQLALINEDQGFTARAIVSDGPLTQGASDIYMVVVEPA
jgi:hypothetical protein